MPQLHPEGDLTGEHRFGDAGQILIAVLFIMAWVVDSFFLGYTTILNQYLPIGIRIPLAILILIVSIYLARKGLAIAFGMYENQSGVIRKSVFGLVRHPIYFGEILFYLGLLLLSISLMAFVVWVFGILFIHYISRYEEKLLLERFGNEYEKYMKEIPMWIPRFWSKK